MVNKLVIRKDTITNAIVFLLISLSSVLNVINFFTNSIGLHTSIDTIIVYTLTIIILLIFIFFYRDNIHSSIIYVLLYSIFIILSVLIHGNFKYIFNLFSDLLTSIVYFWIGICLRDNSITRRTIRISAIFSIVSKSFILLIQKYYFNYFINDDMTASYLLLFPVILIYISYFENHRIVDFVFSIIGTITLLFYGTRGPLLCLCVFFVVYQILFMKKKSFFIFLAFLAIIILWNNQTVDFFYKILYKIDLGRITDLIEKKMLLEDGGRRSLIDNCIKYIEQSPFIGLGTYGDRLYLASFYISTNNVYPHNLFFELWMQYGIILGSIILSSFFIYFIKIFLCSNRSKKIFMSSVFVIIIVKLMVTGSYLNEYLLYFLLGIMCQKESKR